jgi:hypothetical protein
LRIALFCPAIYHRPHAECHFSPVSLQRSTLPEGAPRLRVEARLEWRRGGTMEPVGISSLKLPGPVASRSGPRLGLQPPPVRTVTDRPPQHEHPRATCLPDPLLAGPACRRPATFCPHPALMTATTGRRTSGEGRADLPRHAARQTGQVRPPKRSRCGSRGEAHAAAWAERALEPWRRSRGSLVPHTAAVRIDHHATAYDRI